MMAEMCAIFQLSFDDIIEIKNIADEITKKYGNEAADHCFNTDLYPKNNVPVLGPGNKVSLLKWGFPLKDSSNVVFNARAESLSEKSMFQSYLSNRCLIPASFFYEWGKDKRKYKISIDNMSLIYMAALWKPYIYQGNKLFCFTIITTEPNGQIGQIRSRMPAIIPHEFAQNWLNGDTSALELLKPMDEKMTIITA